MRKARTRTSALAISLEKQEDQGPRCLLSPSRIGSVTAMREIIGNSILVIVRRSMAKFPSQNKLMYVQENGVSNDAWSGAQSGGVAGGLNLPKDLSLLNRRGYASTTTKGVPLVYRCKVDLYATNFDGTGTSAAVGTDFVTTLRAQGCQNNWVMRNAAVKWHAARASMWRQAGVRKSHRGAYTDEIRYCLDSQNDTWIVPVDGSSAYLSTPL